MYGRNHFGPGDWDSTSGSIMNRLRNKSNRRGITRVEVIVVLAACLLLATLFAPSVPYQRRKARGWHCWHTMRQVSLALQNFASGNAGQLPSLSGPLTMGSPTEEKLTVGWPVVLLPALDGRALYMQIKQNIVVEAGRSRIGDTERAVRLQNYTCPEDVNSHNKPGGLSYVVNMGFISQTLYHGDPDGKHVLGSLAWRGTPGDANAKNLQAATGVIWNSDSIPAGSLDYVSAGDGLSSTLLVTENLQAGDWYDTDSTRIGFGFPVTNIDGLVPLGKGQVFESVEKPLNTQFEGGTLATNKSQNWRINSDLKAKVGTLPRPSSNHPGGVNVMMCDGSHRYLSEKIDPHVYLKLLTPNGVTYGEGELRQSDY
jgi:prepilin-type processing-associated H-X9-DG protein